MLSIGKLGPRSEDYYLSLSTADDYGYYLGGEARGRWLGSGAEVLGVDGEVEGEDLRALLRGQDPRDGEALVGLGVRRRVPGFDLTFSAPKSVSVLFGLGRVEGEVVAAHAAAVAAGLSYLETHAVFTRRRVDGALTQVCTEGLTVAAFRHRTSRAGDPQLHTHCLVANAVYADGRWGTLDSRSIYAHARTAGFVYQAVLRGELTARLEVAWTPVRQGFGEIVGIEHAVLRGFSRRRAEIEAAMARRGAFSRAAAQVATLVTRPAKEEGVEVATLRARWEERATELGFDPAGLEHVLGQGSVDLHPAQLRAVTEHQLSPDGLTAHASSFERRDVVRAFCEALPAGAPITPQLLDTLTDGLLRSPEVVPLVGATDGFERRRWSTRELLAIEARLLRTAEEARGACVAVVSEDTAGMALERHPHLAGEQAELVQRLLTSGDGVEVVVGKAGSGKTAALAAAREAWEEDGHQVVGCALAARATAELETSSGIASTTLAGLLIDIERPQGGLLPGTVVVLDEASLVDTRHFARLLDHVVEAEGKLVAVGDHRQLPEVGAGGAFAGLVHHLGATELMENRRQAEAWEREALDELRAGGVGVAVRRYGEHGRLVTGPDAGTVREAMVADWLTARHAGERVLMVAVGNAEVDALNRLARSALVAEAGVHREELVVDERSFAPGDEVVCLRNDRVLGVLNGTLGTVEAVDPERRRMRVRVGADAEVTLPESYLENVTHSYATTLHKAQGRTVDRAFVLADDRLYREAGYVGMSRGRRSNAFYVVTDGQDEDLEAHAPMVEADPLAGLLGNLRRSRAQRLASDDLAEDVPVVSASLVQLWGERDRLEADLLRSARPDAGARLDAATATVLDLQTRLAAAVARREGAEENQGRLRAMPFVKRRSRREVRRRAGHLLDDESLLVGMVRQANADVDGLRAMADAREAWVSDHRHERDRLADLEESISRAERVWGRAAALDPPEHLVARLGRPACGGQERERWCALAGTIESYRSRWGISDARRALGVEVGDGPQALHRMRVSGEIRRLERHLTKVVDLGVGVEL